MTTSTAPPRRNVRQAVRRSATGSSPSARGAGVRILIVLAGVASFLVVQRSPPSPPPPMADLPDGGRQPRRHRPAGHRHAAVLDHPLIIDAPLGVAVALFITHYAPRRLRQGSATSSTCWPRCPSIVFGLWGGVSSHPPRCRSRTGCTSTWLAAVLRRAGLGDRAHDSPSRDRARHHDPPDHHRLCREVFLQTPKLHEEAALALGATRWEMIRMAVLPFGRSGIISGAMLGLGRALGETIAVAIILSASRRRHVQPDQLGQPVDDRGQHRPAVPATPRGIAVNVLIASGLVLFVITLLVNVDGARGSSTVGASSRGRTDVR